MKTFLKMILIAALIAICSAYHNEKCVTIPPEESPETPDTSPDTPDSSVCRDDCPERDRQIGAIMQELTMEYEQMIDNMQKLLKPDEMESFQNWLANTTDVDDFKLPDGIDGGLTQLAMPGTNWEKVKAAFEKMKEKVEKIKDVLKKIWLDLICDPCPPIRIPVYILIPVYDVNGIQVGWLIGKGFLVLQ